MTFYIRNYFGVFWARHFSKMVPFTEEHTWTSRASIFDIDQFMHINNAMYLRLCEYARWSWASCAGMIDYWKKKKCFPVITLVAVRYRRPITFLTKYCIKSRIVHVSEHAFYMTQKFFVKDKLCCSALLELRIVSKEGPLDCLNIFTEAVGAKPIPTVELDPNLKQGLDLFHALEAVLLDKPVPDLTVSSHPSPATSPMSSTSESEASSSSRSASSTHKDD